MIDNFAQYNKTKLMVKTPVTDYLFQVDDSATPLPSQGTPVFHNFVQEHYS